MDESTLHDGEFEWDLEFHGVKYFIFVSNTPSVLLVELERCDSNDRWTAEFTSQYIEEISHKAGNFKKFGVFVKMLTSAFSKDLDSVYVDILTYADLELLKARKLGSSTSQSSSQSSASVTSLSSSSSNKSQMKRYIILTYSGEFDRVHYPLPLAFEENPNPEALQKTIARLRKQLSSRVLDESLPISEKDRDSRQAMAQLRQDNMELRHRLRQSESREFKQPKSVMSPGMTGNAGVAELLAINSKLKRQIIQLKKDLEEAAVSHQKLRTDSAKELARWKMRVGSGTTAASGSTRMVSPSRTTHRSWLEAYAKSAVSPESPGIDGMEAASGAHHQSMVLDLKRRIVLLERELQDERRRSQKGGYASSRRGVVGGVSSGLSASPRSSSYGGASNHTRSATPPSRGPPTHGPIQSSAPSGSRARSVSLSGRMGLSAAAALSGWESDSARRPAQGTSLSRGYRGTAAGTEHVPPRARSYSPGQDGRRSGGAVPPPSASSLGGRFDPTAYQRQRQEQIASRARSGRDWGAGTGVPRGRSAHRESGYSSANSQSSGVSRSTRSGYGSDSSAGSSRSGYISNQRNVSKSKTGVGSGSAPTSGGSGDERADTRSSRANNSSSQTKRRRRKKEKEAKPDASDTDEERKAGIAARKKSPVNRRASSRSSDRERKSLFDQLRGSDEVDGAPRFPTRSHSAAALLRSGTLRDSATSAIFGDVDLQEEPESFHESSAGLSVKGPTSNSAGREVAGLSSERSARSAERSSAPSRHSHDLEEIYGGKAASSHNSAKSAVEEARARSSRPLATSAPATAVDAQENSSLLLNDENSSPQVRRPVIIASMRSDGPMRDASTSSQPHLLRTAAAEPAALGTADGNEMSHERLPRKPAFVTKADSSARIDSTAHSSTPESIRPLQRQSDRSLISSNSALSSRVASIATKPLDLYRSRDSDATKDIVSSSVSSLGSARRATDSAEARSEIRASKDKLQFGSRSIDRPKRLSRHDDEDTLLEEASVATSRDAAADDEISEIDRRILALQSYLDNARCVSLQ